MRGDKPHQAAAEPAPGPYLKATHYLNTDFLANSMLLASDFLKKQKKTLDLAGYTKFVALIYDYWHDFPQETPGDQVLQAYLRLVK